MTKRIDLTGRRFGRLTPIAPGKPGPRSFWLCRCDCGTEKEIATGNLHNGSVKSCGCLNRDNLTTHGKTGTATHRAWIVMRRRVRTHAHYISRGITVDPRWDSYENFLADMGERPAGQTLDRIDNDGPYAPENCRWASRREQANNRGHTPMIIYQGRTQSLGDWARELNVDRGMLYNRIIRNGWSAERAFETPLNPVGGIKGAKRPRKIAGRRPT